MGDAGTILADEASLSQVFEGFKEHTSGHRKSTELVILELLRKSHPNFIVTVSDPLTCDLLGYASAGLATAKREAGKTFDTTRSYTPSRSRIDGNVGVLEDHVRFGRWLYKWNQTEFLLYDIEYANGKYPVRVHFILSLCSQGTDELYHAATDELLLKVGAWTNELHDEIYVFDNSYWQKSKQLWKSVQGASWDDVILNPDLKCNIMKDVQSFFDNRGLYQKLAVPWKRGLIVHGVPGNGKTISIKAIINELQKRPVPVPSLYVKSFDDSCNGKKYSIKSIFRRARIMAPCLLIFEDLDSLVEDEVRSYFLNEVDGLESNDGILMIGSTNHLEGLDSAISKRPSRFDRKYHFKIPSEAERALYCKFWRQKVIDSGLVDFPHELCLIVAKLTEGFSFAYLKELFVIALLTIARGGGSEEDEKVAKAKASVTVTEADAKKEESKEATKKTLIPEVEVPENLSGNLLLKALRLEAQALLDEMDNTEDDKKEDEDKSSDSKKEAEDRNVVASPVA